MIPLTRTISIAHQASATRLTGILAARQATAQSEETAAAQASADQLQRIAEMLDQLREQVRSELERLTAAIGEPSGSAGGWIGQRNQKYVSGHPYATGDLKFTYQVVAPAGWLAAEGAYVRKDDYPELFSVVGNAQDTTATGAIFKLPAPTPLDSHGRWIVRT